MRDIEQKCKVALQALSDWAVAYAPDMCDPETVTKTKARILEHGTLAYIANATDQLHAAILALSEAEKREREARAKALEEAAQVAEAFKRRRLGRDLSKAYFDPCGRWEGGEIHEEGKERDLIASRIRALSHVPLTEPELVDALSALQSEER